MVTISTFTLYPLLLNTVTIRMQYLNNSVQQFLRRRYLKVLHESFYNQTIFDIFSQCKVAIFLTKFNTNYFKDYLSLTSKNYVQQFLKRR